MNVLCLLLLPVLKEYGQLKLALLGSTGLSDGALRFEVSDLSTLRICFWGA